MILWSRMGTPLPAEYTKPDGTAYLSGTEWEYHDAINAREEFGKPTVWVYRRNQVPALNLEDPEFDEKRRQWQNVKAFFQTFVGEDGSLIGGVNPYPTPDEFRRQFEQHLRDRLTAVMQKLPWDKPEEPLPQPSPPSVSDLDVEIRAYCKKAGSLHATLPVAGFATQLKVPIDIAEIYIPLHAMLDLRGGGGRGFFGCGSCGKGVATA